MAFNRKNSEVNGVESEKQRRWRRLTGKKAAWTAFNRKISSVNDVYLENDWCEQRSTEKNSSVKGV